MKRKGKGKFKIFRHENPLTSQFQMKAASRMLTHFKILPRSDPSPFLSPEGSGDPVKGLCHHLPKKQLSCPLNALVPNLTTIALLSWSVWVVTVWGQGGGGGKLKRV